MELEELQIPWEIEQLAAIVAAQEPYRILEIGLWDGATLRRWTSVALEVVGIEIELRPALRAIPDVTLIEGDCADPDVIARARELGPYDMVFVDADHNYAAGRRDFDNYWPLVAPDGMYVLHDIRRYQHGDLDRLWAELSAMGHPTAEFHHRVEQWGGIGILWK